MYNLTWAQDVINKQASTVIEQNSAMCVFYMLAFTSQTILIAGHISLMPTRMIQ